MRTRVQSVGGTLSTRLYRDLQLCHLFPFFSALSFLYSLNSCFYDLRCSSDLVSFYVTHPKTEHHASDVESHRVRLVGARGNGIGPIWSRAITRWTQSAILYGDFTRVASEANWSLCCWFTFL